ncbi:MAG: monovalent cation/H+ antiporter complex subunit F [Acidobacteriota bacterium]
MMFGAAMAGILITMLLALVRAALGPSVYDRLLAANMFGTKTMMLIAVSGFWQGRPEWLDLALVYALVNFASMVAVLKYVRFGSLGDGVADTEAAAATAGDLPPPLESTGSWGAVTQIKNWKPPHYGEGPMP